MRQSTSAWSAFRITKWIVVGACVLGAPGLLFMLIAVVVRGADPFATLPQPTPAATVRTPHLGEHGHLVDSNGGTVPMTLTSSDLGDFVKAIAVKDTTAFVEMAQQGRLRSVATGTSVLVIDVDAQWAMGVSRVRILDGTYAGQAWWVLDNSLKP